MPAETFVVRLCVSAMRHVCPPSSSATLLYDLSSKTTNFSGQSYNAARPKPPHYPDVARSDLCTPFCSRASGFRAQMKFCRMAVW